VSTLIANTHVLFKKPVLIPCLIYAVWQLRILGTERRLHYSHWFRFFTGWNVTDILCLILFSKATWFLLSGHVSGQNSRVLSKWKPSCFLAHPYVPKFVVCCAVSLVRVSWTLFFKDIVEGNWNCDLTPVYCATRMTNLEVGFSKTLMVWLLNRAVVESPSHPYLGRDFRLVLPSLMMTNLCSRNM
jgi:hypothetical protein